MQALYKRKKDDEFYNALTKLDSDIVSCELIRKFSAACNFIM